MATEIGSNYGDLLAEAIRKVSEEQAEIANSQHSKVNETELAATPRKVDVQVLNNRFKAEVERLKVDKLTHDILGSLKSAIAKDLGTDKDTGSVLVTDPNQLNGDEPYVYQNWRFVRLESKSGKDVTRHRFAHIFLKVTGQETAFSIEIGLEKFNQAEYLNMDKQDLTLRIVRSYYNPPTPEQNRQRYLVSPRKPGSLT